MYASGKERRKAPTATFEVSFPPPFFSCYIQYYDGAVDGFFLMATAESSGRRKRRRRRRRRRKRGRRPLDKRML